MLGQRGSGKTVLLWELADLASDAGFIVASPTIVSKGMLERIVEKIQDSGERFVSEGNSRLTGGSVGALGFSMGLQFARDIQETKSFQYKLTQLARKLTGQGKGILILVDELQANSPEVRQLVIAYQELVGEGLNVALAMAGLPGAVAATLNDHVLTFLNRARKVILEPLAISEVDAFFDQAFRKLELTIAPDLRREAAQTTQGSPYLLQLIGHNITLFTGEDGNVTRAVLDNAIQSSETDFENDVCRTTLAALSGRDVDFLRAASIDTGSSRMSDIAQRMGVTADYAQKYRKRLIDAGIITAAGRSEVSFAVPFLASYLRTEE
jgi:hypothetical protein